VLRLIFAALTLLAVILTPIPTLASVVTFAVYPSRPQVASALAVTMGTFEGYRLYQARGIVDSTITIRDSHTGEERSYYLAQRPTLNGAPLRCESSAWDSNSPSPWYLRYCNSIDSRLVPGRTTIALLFWSFTYLQQSFLGTDQIVSF